MTKTITLLLACMLLLNGCAVSHGVDDAQPSVTHDLQVFDAALLKAQAGAPEDQYRVARMYDTGDVVPQSTRQALIWYTKAAEQGHVKSQYNLGISYGRGDGVVQSYPQAAFWLNKAALQGDVDAQAILGDMYSEGLGVPQDFKQAYVWLSLAAVEGDTEVIKHRDQAAVKLTPRGLEEAQQAASVLAQQIGQQRYQ